jgi:hypothetical protein
MGRVWLLLGNNINIDGQLHPDHYPLQNRQVPPSTPRQEKTSSDGFGSLARGRIAAGRTAPKEGERELDLRREIEIVVMVLCSCPRARLT